MFVLILWIVEQRILHSGGSRPLDNGRGASVWSKNRGGGGRTPSLDPLLLHLERVVPLYCQRWIQEGGGEGGLGG